MVRVNQNLAETSPAAPTSPPPWVCDRGFWAHHLPSSTVPPSSMAVAAQWPRFWSKRGHFGLESSGLALVWVCALGVLRLPTGSTAQPQHLGIPCEAYDVNTGRGRCNGVDIDIGAVICATSFDAARCVAFSYSGMGVYFKGTPPGNPSRWGDRLHVSNQYYGTVYVR
jgi:hypothetical protein